MSEGFNLPENKAVIQAGALCWSHNEEREN